MHLEFQLCSWLHCCSRGLPSDAMIMAASYLVCTWAACEDQQLQTLVFPTPDGIPRVWPFGIFQRWPGYHVWDGTASEWSGCRYSRSVPEWRHFHSQQKFLLLTYLFTLYLPQPSNPKIHFLIHIPPTKSHHLLHHFHFHHFQTVNFPLVCIV